MHDVEMARTTAAAVGSAHLEMRWVPATDERGRTRMEAVWIEVSTAPSVPTPHAA